MDFITVFILAIGLSFDTFAVSVTCGLLRQQMNFRQAVRIAAVFSFVQALFPFVGWLIGVSVSRFISSYDHWIAFGLLTLLGVKMIVESQKKHEEKTIDPYHIHTQLKLAVATSIDALIVGLGFGFLSPARIAPSLIIIGLVTFVVAMLGMLFGKKARGLLGGKMEIMGGLILIGIGVKILLEHVL
jgi:manganese efflux pump family protein